MAHLAQLPDPTVAASLRGSIGVWLLIVVCGSAGCGSTEHGGSKAEGAGGSTSSAAAGTTANSNVATNTAASAGAGGAASAGSSVAAATDGEDSVGGGASSTDGEALTGAGGGGSLPGLPQQCRFACETDADCCGPNAAQGCPNVLPDRLRCGVGGVCERNLDCQTTADCTASDGSEYLCISTADAGVCTKLNCRGDGDCGAGERCDTSRPQGLCYTPCNTPDDCPTASPGSVSQCMTGLVPAEPTQGQCQIFVIPQDPLSVPYCTSDADCLAAQISGRFYCAASGLCVSCLEDAHCEGSQAGPHCHPTQKACTCTSDDECSGLLSACGYN